MALGYGVDTWCADSLVTGRLDSGRGLVARALYRRFITPRGTLSGGTDEQVYGFDLSAYVGSSDADLVLRTLPAIMRAEALKDDRIADVVVTVSQDVTARDGTISITAIVSLRLVDEATFFDLTMSVSDVSTTILGLAA
jgi:hypothetical protein